MTWIEDQDFFDTDGEDDEGVEIKVEEVRAETDKALLVVVEGDEIWLPKSQIFYEDLKRSKFGRRHGTVTIPTWLADEKELT